MTRKLKLIICLCLSLASLAAVAATSPQKVERLG